MKLLTVLPCFAAILAAGSTWAAPAPSISGDYLEVRSCNVFAGACITNGEMGVTGKEGILVWSVREGHWNGIPLDGLNVIAVIRANDTLGDQRHQPRSGKAVLIVDAKATSSQKEALADLARSLSGSLIEQVVETKVSTLDVALNGCSTSSCASVNAAGLVEISTQCLAGKKHLCGNEETFYPPLTTVQNAFPAFTEVAAYHGSGLNLTWQDRGQSSAFIGTFSQ
jgi:hypothetical protein